MEVLKNLNLPFPVCSHYRDANGSLADLPHLDDMNGNPYLQLWERFPALKPLYPFDCERNFMAWDFLESCRETMLLVVALCGLYVLLCFAGKRVMKNRKAFDLRGALAAWNLLLSVFSFIGAMRVVPHLLMNVYDKGLYVATCDNPEHGYGHGAAGFWVAAFIFSKIPELFDTMFIVLRKKPLIFLHWYHHITVLMFCWHAYSTKSATGLVFVAMNYTVHAIMYFYYFLAAIGHRARWGLLVTIFQLSQMVVGVAACASTIYHWHQGRSCHVHPESLKWGIIMYSSYFALFLKFFIERYFLKGSKSSSRPKKE